MLYDATTRALFADFDRFNGVVAELEAKGRGGPAASGTARPRRCNHRLELDMRYGNQLVTMAVVADRTRLETVRRRDGADATCSPMTTAAASVRAVESPEAGIRITTIRVASYVEGETVEFDASLPDGEPVPANPVGSRRCHFVGIAGPVDTPVYDETALQPGAHRARPGRGHDAHHDLPGRARLASGDRRARRDLVPQELTREETFR